MDLDCCIECLEKKASLKRPATSRSVPRLRFCCFCRLLSLSRPVISSHDLHDPSDDALPRIPLDCEEEKKSSRVCMAASTAMR